MSRMLTIVTVLSVLGSLGLIVLGQPDLEDKIAWQAPEFDQLSASRSVQIDPAELVDLMHNNQVRLLLIDVRDESDYNMFHLLDARHTTQAELNEGLASTIHSGSVVVIMSNDEKRASRAWRMLQAQGISNSYILAGGINLWLEVYGASSETPPRRVDVVTAGPGVRADEPMNYTFSAAIGDRIDIAWPDPTNMRLPDRPYTPKARVVDSIAAEGTGCG